MVAIIVENVRIFFVGSYRNLTFIYRKIKQQRRGESSEAIKYKLYKGVTAWEQKWEAQRYGYFLEDSQSSHNRSGSGKEKTWLGIDATLKVD